MNYLIALIARFLVQRGRVLQQRAELQRATYFVHSKILFDGLCVVVRHRGRWV